MIGSPKYNVLGGQIRHVVALPRYVDVNPDGSLSDSRHPRVVDKRLVHGVCNRQTTSVQPV